MSAKRSDQTGTNFGPPSALRPAERSSLAFGIERIGLISLRFPTLVTIVLIFLCIAAGFGIERIKIDDSLSQLFRSDTAEFKAIRRGRAPLPVERIRCARRR